MDEQQQSSDEERLRKAWTKRLREMQIEQQKRDIAKRVMTTEAYERLMNVRVSNFELYSQVVDLLISMAQNNKLYAKLTEEQLRSLLSKLTFRPESKIEFKHK